MGTRIHVTGIVQGVGFRPFIYNQAIRNGLTGWVCNTSAGVDIEISGEPGLISNFIQSIKTEAPPLARIDSIEHHQIPNKVYSSFEIIQSVEVADAFQPISPDICICPDCLKELFDPSDRRYRYPFINCTNCGPRLTIIEEIPYDRPKTTMKTFPMCPDCHSEYSNPLDRRFHAQPIACPTCGPHVWLEFTGNHEINNQKPIVGDDAIITAQKLLLQGGIIAVKGLGGFHLACDATNSKAVSELRRRKLRVDKPFALMMRDIATVETHCDVTEAELKLLESHERPIVILHKKKSSISNVAGPNQDTLGVMLPYTPLHYLLLSSQNKNKKNKLGKVHNIPPLVMTSGNISEEPIAISNEEAVERLSGLADAFLMHNRDIRTRCDDSVIRLYHGETFPIRRSRGYAPFPVYLNSIAPQMLAVGGELKNTFCITRDQYAFLSHHIGDMENVETFNSFADSIAHYESLFRVKPQAIAYDLHPNYLSTRYALERAKSGSLALFPTQHHHAHIASCMIENSIPQGEPVIGVAFDGTGYGDDGAIWGGEFLIADYLGNKRLAHLKYIPLPGGDTAIRKPARTALAYLWANGVDWDPGHSPVTSLCPEERTILKTQLEKKINSPFTSSMGRFFDAAASLAGVRQQVNYEAQAAIEFEALADPSDMGEYRFGVDEVNSPIMKSYEIDPSPLLNDLLHDVMAGIPVSKVSSRFHNTVARMVIEVCRLLRTDFGINQVCLSGGVWQNMKLLHTSCQLLKLDGFTVFTHQKVPTNDGGLALGQAAIAIHRLRD